MEFDAITLMPAVPCFVVTTVYGLQVLFDRRDGVGRSRQQRRLLIGAAAAFVLAVAIWVGMAAGIDWFVRIDF